MCFRLKASNGLRMNGGVWPYMTCAAAVHFRQSPTMPSFARGARNDQLKAVDRLRAKEAQRADITGAFLRSAREDLGITKTDRRAAEFRQRVESCEAGLKAIGAPSKIEAAR